jgi:hypothetical protein
MSDTSPPELPEDITADVAVLPEIETDKYVLFYDTSRQPCLM